MNFGLSDNTARCLYLEFFNAIGYEEQEPAAKYAKWYDLLWLLIPIAGILGFVLAINNRYENRVK